MEPTQQQQPVVPQSRSASGASTATARSHSSRSSNPDKQISQIEKSVTHLLVATKQLLETLTQWSRGNAQEEEVSDVYVRLGYEFNLACRAFNSIGVETSDLGPVPDLLRTILEDTLSQPASPQALDNYLPRIRDIIINLLQGLKRKQSKLRRPTKDAASSSRAAAQPARQMSATSVAGDPEGMADQPTTSGIEARRGSPVGTAAQPLPTDTSVSQPSMERSALRRSIRREPQRQQQIQTSEASSMVSSTAAPNIPIIPPLPQRDNNNSVVAAFPHAPPPPPKQDALTALQRGGDLERRASRRFSAYQIQKHLGASPNGVPVIPPAQNSPVPNRGREVRESMRAVTSRTSYQAARQKTSTSKLQDVSPNRAGPAKHPQRISEEREAPPSLDTLDTPKLQPPGEQHADHSPTARTPDEYRQKKGDIAQSPGPQLGATVNGPFSPSKEHPEFGAGEDQQEEARIASPTRDQEVDEQATSTSAQPTLPARSVATPPPDISAVDLDSTPGSAKELTLFLQYKTRIKKFVLPGGYEDLTLARLQLAFIEKFNWNTHNNGVDLPEIYIQDPISGVRHELEDLNDVKDRSVLVLNFEVLDEVKKHFDEGIGGLRSTLEGVRSLLDGQSTMMQRFSDRQLEASKEMARLSAAPTPRSTRTTFMEPSSPGAKPGVSLPASEEQLQEVANLRRDIAVLRQTYAAMSADFTASMNDIKSKAANVKAAADDAALPSYAGNAGRAHVNEGKKQLMGDSEILVNRVDNLSDTVEDLRKDVVSRGVRPRPRDLEVLSKEISSVSKDLARLKDFMKREKPVWTKIWEQELNLVCTERDDLTQQEELMADLFGDLEDVQNVFNLVEEAMKQQNLNGPGALRSTSANISIDPTVDPSTAKEGVLDEVRALRPNHEDRLEAIERAERQRQKDLANRAANEFQREVEQFVEQGKLKKTGGMDEVERLRKIKDERAMKENWETQRLIEEEKARKKAEREAKKAALAKAAAEAEAGQEVKPGEGADGESAVVPASAHDAVTEPVPAILVSSDGAHDAAHDATGLEHAAHPPVATVEDAPVVETPVVPQETVHTPHAPHQVPHPVDGEGAKTHDDPFPNTEADDKSDERASSPAKDEKRGSSWWKPAVF